MNVIDLKVLQFVIKDGVGLPDVEIAKRLRLKPATVTYSIGKMRKDKVIVGSRYKLDYRVIGLDGIAWVLFSVGDNGSSQRELVQELLKFPQVHVAALISGEYDLAIKVVDKDVSSLSAFLRELSEKFPDILKQPQVLFATEQFKAHNLCVDSVPKKFNLKPLDLALLDCKMESPDAKMIDVSKKLSVHKNTISRRWKALCGAGAVLKKSPILNSDHFFKAGISLKAMVLFDVPPRHRELFIRTMRGLPQVHELYSLLSEHNFLAVVRTRDMIEFYSFISALALYDDSIVNTTLSYFFMRVFTHPPNYFSELKKAGVISF